MSAPDAFDELRFFAQVKKQPGAFLGRKSLLSLRDQLFGMSYAFGVCGYPEALSLFRAFTNWYNSTVLSDRNGYACWWNHLLYTSGGMDDLAFDRFFHAFEQYIADIHGLTLPEM